MNSEEPFDVRHYLSKTLQLQFVLKTLYKEYRIGLWMVPLYYLSLTCRSIPHRRAHKKGRNSHPGTFHRPSANMLFLLTIYVKNIENLTYIASTKKPGHPHFQKKQTNKQTNNRRYCFTRPKILRTHTDTDKTKQWKVSFNLPTFTIPPALVARSSGLFLQAASRTDNSR